VQMPHLNSRAIDRWRFPRIPPPVSARHKSRVTILKWAPRQTVLFAPPALHFRAVDRSLPCMYKATSEAVSPQHPPARNCARSVRPPYISPIQFSQERRSYPTPHGLVSPQARTFFGGNFLSRLHYIAKVSLTTAVRVFTVCR